MRALDPLTNAPNSLAASSGGIPIPVSETSIRQVDLTHLVTTRTSPPEFENLTALPMRLSRTWSSRRGSAGVGGPSPASRWIVTPTLAASGWAFLTASAARPEIEHVAQLKRQPARLEPVQHQQVIDQREQPVGVPLDDLEEPDAIRRQPVRLAPQQLTE